MKGIAQYLHELLYLLGENRKKVIFLLGLIFLSSCLDILGLGIIGPYIALVMNPAGMVQGKIGHVLADMGIPVVGRTSLMVLGLGLMGIFFFKALAAILINVRILQFSMRCRIDLQGKLMRAYQQQPYVEHLQRNSSEYIKTVYEATANFVTTVDGFLRMVSQALISVCVLTFLAVTNGKILAILLVVFGGIIVLYNRFFRRRAKLYGEQTMQGVQRLLQGVQEGIVGLKELRILGKTGYFHAKVVQAATELTGNWAKATLISTAPQYLMEFIMAAFVISFIVISLLSGGEPSAVLPTLAVFAIASLRLLPSANLLTSGISKLSYNRHSVTLLYEDLKKVEKYTTQEPVEVALTHVAAPFEILSLQNVSFRYPNASQPALKSITLSIKPGESIGIIGPSGSGKTTLIDVLLGLLEPQEGRLLFNQRPLKDALQDWRSHVAYLPQEIFLLDNSLRTNIALGVPEKEIDEARIQEAIQQAQLSEMVKELPKGVETMVGERGVRISGGQRQRVALARAFYFGRDVLILDEATSALDHQTEREIVEEIKRLKGRKTLIVIAHRLTTVEHCDRIYKLKQGEVVETGNYELVVGKDQ